MTFGTLLHMLIHPMMAVELMQLGRPLVNSHLKWPVCTPHLIWSTFSFCLKNPVEKRFIDVAKKILYLTAVYLDIIIEKLAPLISVESSRIDIQSNLYNSVHVCTWNMCMCTLVYSINLLKYFQIMLWTSSFSKLSNLLDREKFCKLYLQGQK